ncbi:hypothetical protein PHLCEN_2v12984 [Hermanssonia centrifuga]|uniref:Uncharacterized protein n=1 Tax=Hermanssonia centrifuga TaxID=98765 RepID=A0A2R6NFV1_9APHY|nr:hypothetical protein PHLCEN_2v12984 [Hermanssonia centrifuga]
MRHLRSTKPEVGRMVASNDRDRGTDNMVAYTEQVAIKEDKIAGDNQEDNGADHAPNERLAPSDL